MEGCFLHFHSFAFNASNQSMRWIARCTNKWASSPNNMASIRLLKKEINKLAFDLLQECFAYRHYSEELSEDRFDEVIKKINHLMLEALLIDDMLIGDFVMYSPANTTLTILYPSWETAVEIILADEVTYFQSDLALNELMAINDTTIADNYGEFDDWIEITNSGSSSINLSNHFLTDDISEPFKFAFPDTVINPGEYFIVWADDDPGQGSMHADFKLTSAGEEVFLLYSLMVIDDVEFPPLQTDVSYGRWPDATGAWEILSIATPGAQNQGGTGISGPDELILGISAPNPICSHGLISIQGVRGIVRLDVYDLSGRLVDTPFEDEIVNSESFSWDASSLSTGVYFLRLTQGENTVIRKVTVLE